MTDEGRPQKRKAKDEELYVMHRQECSKEGCCILIPIYIPRTITDHFVIDRKRICGACTAEEFERVTAQLMEIGKGMDGIIAAVVEVKKSKDATPSGVPMTVQSAPDVSTLLTQVRSEKKAQEKKVTNVIISGTKPEEDDKMVVKRLADVLEIDIDSGYTTRRVGEKKEDGQQLLLVDCKTEACQQLFLVASRKLKETEEYKEIYVNPDLSKEERNAQYILGMN